MSHNFPTVAHARRSAGHTDASPFDQWFVVAKFDRASLRERTNMAMLREAIEKRSASSNAVHIADTLNQKGEMVGYLFLVAPHVDRQLVFELLRVIELRGTLDEPTLANALMPEVRRRWKNASISLRFAWIATIGVGESVPDDAILEDEPPFGIVRQIMRGID